MHNWALPFHSQVTCISVTWSQSCAHYFSLKCELLFLRVILSVIKAPRLIFSFPCVFNLALCSSMMESGIYLVELRSLLFYCSVTWNLEYSLSPSYVICGGSVVKNPPVRKIPWRRKWQLTPVFLPWKSHGQGRLAGFSSSVTKKKKKCVYIYIIHI